MNITEIKKLDKERIVPTYARYDMVAEKGAGACCWSKEGKKYIDFTAGIGVNCLGFCDRGWIEAVTEQLGKLQHVSNLFYTEPQVKVAEMLTERSGMAKVFFGNSGAEANEAAIKTARKYGFMKKGEKAYKIITLENSFHGRTMAAITATGQEHYHKFFTPFLEGFEYCPANDGEAMERLADENTCAIMMEMVQGEGGVVPLEAEFVKKAEKICREKGILLIADEVQTGIGRTGKLFAYEHFGIQPDIVTFAKGIGGGLPIGGALFGEKCCDTLQPGDHGTTYGGNPVACAGAVEVLKRMDGAFLAEVEKKGSYIKEKLQAIPKVKKVTGMGMMLGVEIEGKKAADAVAESLEKGLMILTAKDRVRLLPPLTITFEEIDEGIEILKSVLK
ncbi:MAG TPA: aspartate aminotransferase family protein [Candidatus Copromorpha excrementigallinarum]|uniref:Acetylornithine aminotransferase n=1 Tax=Candidatus Allocopromorpha excrementigallinarum TaxID=2840742 RepID=A0A9D1I2N4_9FIRM|nr:aspartate aminotransferase family protein [Candidatus Copromorpha excrementigallinarum]